MKKLQIILAIALITLITSCQGETKLCKVLDLETGRETTQLLNIEFAAGDTILMKVPVLYDQSHCVLKYEVRNVVVTVVTNH